MMIMVIIVLIRHNTMQRNAIKQAEPDRRFADGFGLPHWRKRAGELQRDHYGEREAGELKVNTMNVYHA